MRYHPPILFPFFSRTINFHTRSVDLIRSFAVLRINFQQVLRSQPHPTNQKPKHHPTQRQSKCSSSSSPSLSLPSWPLLLPRTVLTAPTELTPRPPPPPSPTPLPSRTRSPVVSWVLPSLVLPLWFCKQSTTDLLSWSER